LYIMYVICLLFRLQLNARITVSWFKISCQNNGMALVSSNIFQVNILSSNSHVLFIFSIFCTVRCPPRSTQCGVTRTRCRLLCTSQPSVVLLHIPLRRLFFFLFSLFVPHVHARAHTDTHKDKHKLIHTPSFISPLLPSPPSIPSSFHPL
jgi:hypothetical protein